MSPSSLTPALLIVTLLFLAGCASREPVAKPPPLRPAQARALIDKALPTKTGDGDRAGWVTDIYATFATLRLVPNPSNVCAVVAVTEQESGFRADPTVPGLAAIAWKQIDDRARDAGVPSFLVRSALHFPSPDGRSYSERIDHARTERDLSDLFEDLIGLVPLGQRLFAGWNPVRTGGPMQVSVAFAQAYAQHHPYPYPVVRNIRHEVFTRRGGMYFGSAHLLDYPVTYDEPLYRFADFNAGHYASRNAAFQSAISLVSGVPLVPDGDLVLPGGSKDVGHTEAAARTLAEPLGMTASAIQRDLEKGDGPALERTRLYQRVFEWAGKIHGQPLPHAMLPQIELHGPKITRKLTTAWFAQRVDERYRRCMGRAGS